jgi:hypothetical protein
MKKLLFALLLLPGVGFGQGWAESHEGIFWDTSHTHLGIGSAVFGSVQHSLPALTRTDCEPWEKFSDWNAETEGTKECLHVWVYAEWGDVNQVSMIQTSQYCQCGCDKQETEARICAACSRHEKRIRFYGWESVEKKSPYLELLKKVKQ